MERRRLIGVWLGSLFFFFLFSFFVSSPCFFLLDTYGGNSKRTSSRMNKILSCTLIYSKNYKYERKTQLSLPRLFLFLPNLPQSLSAPTPGLQQYLTASISPHPLLLLLLPFLLQSKSLPTHLTHNNSQPQYNAQSICRTRSRRMHDELIS